MIINEISLFNWMIFRGSQKVRLASGSENISLIFGENMHGKTSLLNAIRWCLYGEAINRQGRPIASKDLINIKAERDDETIVSVGLNFLLDEDEYELVRELDYSQLTPAASKTLKINGRLVDGGKVDATIESVLPKQISQFMLFDGELLKDFENLVVAIGSAQATGIKNAIEESLGIPMLRNSLEQAESVAKACKQESKKELQKNSSAKLLAEKLSELEVQQEVFKNEKEVLKERLSSSVEEQDDLAEALHDTEEAIKLISRRQEIENNLVINNQKQEDFRTNLKSMTAELWIAPLKKALAPALSENNRKLEQINAQASEQSSKTMQIIKLENSLRQNNCPTCGQTLSSSQIEEMSQELTTLKQEVSQIGDVDEIKFSLMTRIKELNIGNNVKDETERYKAALDQDRELVVDILNAENSVFEINQKLKGVDEQTSLLTRKKYDAVVREIGILEKDIERLDEDIEKTEDQIKTIRKSDEYKNITQDSGVVKKAELAQQLVEVFSSAIALYRDRMRSKIERRATETFENLTTETTFDKLEINESYGLSLIVDGTKVNRSAGAEQIVAMSLIEALNHYGRRKGPMVMDTPVGRLDSKHRKNILEYLPSVVTQLAIFAHSGELSEDNNIIDPKRVGARYKINRTSTFEAQIINV